MNLRPPWIDEHRFHNADEEESGFLDRVMRILNEASVQFETAAEAQHSNPFPAAEADSQKGRRFQLFHLKP